jgi:hypothetical protein
MSEHGFFESGGFGIRKDDVHFLPTRAEKLVRISELECDVFVDDLREVLDDPAFPGSVKRVLFSEKEERTDLPYAVCADWPSIEEALFVGR